MEIYRGEYINMGKVLEMTEERDQSILSKVGNTPLIKIKNLTKGLKGVEIYAKAEWYNPGGSVKIRPALRMIIDGERSGILTKGKTILDSTSGNTGVAYALIGWVKGYAVKLVVPGNVCIERKKAMREIYNAEIVLSDPIDGSDGAIMEVHKIYNEDPDKYFMPDQYNNPSNWKAHFDTTAVEIIEQTKGRVTHFVAGIGTGGTVMGTGRGLKRYNKDIKVIAVEPLESLHGIEGLKHMGSSIVPGIYDESFLDGKISVKTEDSYKMVSRLAREEGLVVGHSSGAVMKASLELAQRLNDGVIVTIFPDSCECYVAIDDFKRTREPVREKPIQELNIKGEVCPYTFVKSKLAIEKLEPGDILRIIVDHFPALDNVPRSLTDDGHEILKINRLNNTDWEIVVKKSRR
ncbi:MAG: pyridoxal-phosphate dependent enzyme [Nitrospinae bacterium]|nr:pyridoxal-phosphate dependent enzyme [Nitrospinota bacterium]